MVDEFSSFARMPSPEMKDEDIVRICRDTLVLPRNAHPEISIETDFPEKPVVIPCDARQMSQVITNIVQNAIDAIDGREPPEQGSLPEGRIRLSIAEQADTVILEVSDNGRGLPPEGRERLTEPYVTTRAKGTGLGLAIVKQILEDHGASLELEDGEQAGACIRIVLPRHAVADAITDKQAANGN
jgi:two-component system nitrogen regulation sensor histidine kinase NtrY